MADNGDGIIRANFAGWYLVNVDFKGALYLMSKTLKERIVRHIETTGPLPVAEYMHWCLADSEAGYYTNAQVLGREGDFVTAPEVSQMFGELIGVWAIQAWQNMGAPDFCFCCMAGRDGFSWRIGRHYRCDDLVCEKSRIFSFQLV